MTGAVSKKSRLTLCRASAIFMRHYPAQTGAVRRRELSPDGESLHGGCAKPTPGHQPRTNQGGVSPEYPPSSTKARMDRDNSRLQMQAASAIPPAPHG